jgi:hypothetical protein
LIPEAIFADTVVGSRSAAFQNWTAADLDQDGKPYWDNVSMDGDKRDVGYYLINAPTAHLSGAPGALPFWGNAYNPATDTGGTADTSFYFQSTAPSLTASLKLEVAGNSNINQFGWYDITRPSVLHPLFLGPDAAPATEDFTPSTHYGFYLTSSDGTFFTQSSLNPCGDTTHQHFALFQESSTSGAESYWLGIEDLTLQELNGREGCVGDYNDMLVRICADPAIVVPEPSTAALALVGLSFMLGLLKRRHR